MSVVDDDELTPRDRRRAVAALLATGFRRFRDAVPIPPDADSEQTGGDAANVSKLSLNPLDVSAGKSVTVHSG